MNNLLDQRKIGIIVGALVIVGAGIWFFQESSEKKNQEGKTALYQVQQTFDTEYGALLPAEREIGAKVDIDSKLPKTVTALNGLLSAKTVSHRTLFEAGVKLGSLYLDHGSAEKAATVFKNTTQFASSSFQKASGFYLLATAQERASQFKEALASYQESMNEGVEGLKGDDLLGMVRMSIKLGDKERAKLFLEKLNKEVPGSKAAETADSLVKGAA